MRTTRSREYIKKKYYTYGVSKVLIERAQEKVVINIHTSKPGMLIGTKGAGVEQLKKELAAIVKANAIHINILEVKRPDMDAVLVAESVAQQLEKRSSFRRNHEAGHEPRYAQRSKGCKDYGSRPS